MTRHGPPPMEWYEHVRRVQLETDRAFVQRVILFADGRPVDEVLKYLASSSVGLNDVSFNVSVVDGSEYGAYEAELSLDGWRDATITEIADTSAALLRAAFEREQRAKADAERAEFEKKLHAQRVADYHRIKKERPSGMA